MPSAACPWVTSVVCSAPARRSLPSAWRELDTPAAGCRLGLCSYWRSAVARGCRLVARPRWRWLPAPIAAQTTPVASCCATRPSRRLQPTIRRAARRLSLRPMADTLTPTAGGPERARRGGSFLLRRQPLCHGCHRRRRCAAGGRRGGGEDDIALPPPSMAVAAAAERRSAAVGGSRVMRVVAGGCAV